jgi:lysophospholipase L1-like esterase
MRPLLQIMAASVCAACLSGMAGTEPKVRETGPSPYPTVAADWPGEGVVRVFEWMKPNRESFWRQRQQKQGAWVLAGDSLLGNWRTSERDLAPRPVANRAIGGDVSRGLLFRFQEDVLDLHPSGIVLLIGGNDLSALQSTDQTARNIGRMLEAIKAQDASLPVILCTLPPRDSAKAPIKHAELAKLNASIRQLAAINNNVVLLDLYPLFATADENPQPSLFTEDRLHISAAGYKVLSKTLNAQLESLPRVSM